MGRDISAQGCAHAPAAAAFFPPSPSPELRVKQSTLTLSDLALRVGLELTWLREQKKLE